MKAKTKKLAPPGFNVTAELEVYGLTLAAAVLYSISFLIQFFQEYNALYATHELLRQGAVMTDFAILTENVFTLFWVPVFMALGYIFIHYRYHYKDAMSIYLMKRLPERMELHRRCLILPLSAMASALFVAAALLGIYFAVYMLVTPEECLTPNQFEKVWRGIL